MRGEDPSISLSRHRTTGSPPHARGRPLDQLKSAQDHGITPACAGKTSSMPTASTPRTDHPRMRGEDLVDANGVNAQNGSPPHARGRRSRPVESLLSRGITPACAGKTSSFCCLACQFQDHPRMRGEDNRLFDSTVPIAGSPPHARGRRRIRFKIL